VEDVKRLIEEVAYNGSQVDSVLVCINAQVMYYPTKVGTIRGTLSSAEERAKWPASEKQRSRTADVLPAGVDPIRLCCRTTATRGAAHVSHERRPRQRFSADQFLVDHPDWRLGTNSIAAGRDGLCRDEVRQYTFRRSRKP
jgi:hypothetical protein